MLPFDTPDHPLGDTNQISVLLADSINRLRRGQLDPRVANAMGYLASVLLEALESARIEDRLALIAISALLILWFSFAGGMCGRYDYPPWHRPMDLARQALAKRIAVPRTPFIVPFSCGSASLARPHIHDWTRPPAARNSVERSKSACYSISQ